MTENQIKHHISDPVLLAYSTGTLPEAYGLVVACHVSLCPHCRAVLDGFDAMGGAVLEHTEKTEMGRDALAQTFARISTPPATQKAPEFARSDFPAPLQQYVGGGPEKVNWRKIGGGVKQAILPISGEANARLLYIPAGRAVPDHSHNGLEMTLVLQGAFSDEVDRFGRGDVEFGDEDLTHTPIAEAGQDCICLAAADAPLKFNSFLPKLMQPWLKI